jgi:hypothetical protein
MEVVAQHELRQQDRRNLTRRSPTNLRRRITTIENMRRDREVADDRDALVEHYEGASSLARCVSCRRIARGLIRHPPASLCSFSIVQVGVVEASSELALAWTVSLLPVGSALTCKGTPTTGDWFCEKTTSNTYDAVPLP